MAFRYQMLQSNRGTSKVKDDAHTKTKEAIQQGAGVDDVQLLINQYGTRTNSFGLTKFADQYRESFERQQDIADALDDLLLRGEPPQIRLADYVPANWLPMFRVWGRLKVQ